MRIAPTLGFLGLVILPVLFPEPVNAVTPQTTGATAAERCTALINAEFSKVPDAPTQVLSSSLVDAKDDAPAYCEIRGYVAPDVGFALRLPPDRWNGKFIELGCGGSCGSEEHIAGCNPPVRKGFACIVSDGGHKSNGGEMKWAYNNPQAAIEYLVRASHVTALAGKAIVAHYYSQDPNKSYFMGCSAGGIQAMWEAQRFPWDFNGIVAGGPALRLSGSWANWLWNNRALMGRNGEPALAKSDLELLHRAVVAKCDLNDGVKDGVIGDPRACHFEPSEIRCTAGKSGNCLTAPQVEAVEKIYNGPVDSKGERLGRPIALRGSEISWSVLFGGTSKAPTPFFNYLKDWFAYSIFQVNLGAGWKPEDFDFDRDYKRLAAMEALEPNNPDLRKFKAAGGKLLAYTGWNDAIEGALNTADYYETAERTVGGRAPTQDFFRLFVIPGMNHCSGGDGAYAVDYLTSLESWVENGEAPDKVIGAHLKLDDLMEKAEHGDRAALQTLERRMEFPLDPSNVEFARPIYPYPTRTKYLGHGDPNQPSSFGPVQP